MAPQAQNGEPNTSRPVAILAMGVLAISLVIFWNNIPILFPLKKRESRVIRISGISSMLVVPLMLTGLHDSVINTAALLGCIAIITVLINLFRFKMYYL